MLPERGPPDRSEAEFLAEARSNLARNYTAHLLHGIFGQTGFRLIQAPTFIPYYLFLLSGSELVVGLARGVQSLGQALTPVFSATRVEHRARVLPLGFLVGGLMRLQVLGIALAGFFLPREWTIVAICLFLALFGFFLGMQGVIFGFLMSKVIPLDLRGRLMGLRNFLAGLTASMVAGLGGYLVAENVLGNGYASTFLLAFVLTTLGLAMLGFMREPPTPIVRERSNLAGRLADLPALLRSDREFTTYFLVRALATMGRMTPPFYLIYAGTQMGVEFGGFEIGVLTTAWMLAMTVTNLLWGVLADRSGFRLVFLGAIAVWVGAVLALMSVTSLLGLSLVFMCIGAGMGGFQLSSQNLVLEFGSRPNLPLRIAVANTASELVGGIGPILGGVLAVTVSYVPLFWIAIACQMAALALMLLFVREPRNRR